MYSWLSYSSVLYACMWKKSVSTTILSDQISLFAQCFHFHTVPPQRNSRSNQNTHYNRIEASCCPVFIWCKIQFTRSNLIRISIPVCISTQFYRMRNENTSINHTFYRVQMEKLLKHKPINTYLLSSIIDRSQYIKAPWILVRTTLDWNQSFKRSMDASHCSN